MLQDILEQCTDYPFKTLVFLGDYISRGPSPEEVIQILRKTEGIFLAGNHEIRFLEYWNQISDRDSRNTLLKTKRISEESVLWMQSSLRVVYETEDCIFSHSGLNPNKSLSEQTVYDYCESFWKKDYYSLTGKSVVHGHISVSEVSNIGNNWFVDTGCGFGGKLSALVLPEKRILRSRENSLNWTAELFFSEL